ncbi:MAG: DUF4349 domain-containing protein [Gemmataceae bacterium]|nr:DUF4349 domain-containing protein [Gemmataceae bacterium]MDW8267011.1 DUF4349 domain-containing protein [Gemmataceae bacterium]
MKPWSATCLGLLGVALWCGCGGQHSAKVGVFAENEARQEAPGGAAWAGGEQPRKIIYTAHVTLVVEKLDQGRSQLDGLVAKHQAYVAKSDVQGVAGQPRYGTWTVRVPANRLHAFLADLAEIGELQRQSLDSDDITERYYDLKARLKNKQTEEQRLLDLLEESTGNLKDILAVEEHLSRVRGEIEQMQGQMQRWDKLVEHATVVISMRERRDYVPATAPDFSTSIARTWHGSVDSLVEFGKGVVLAAVGLTPWLPIIAVVGFPMWWLLRRMFRRQPQPPVEPVHVEGAPVNPLRDS